MEKDVREYSKIDIGNFKEDLFFSPINSTEFTSVNDAVDIYLKTVENLLDKHAPCIKKKLISGGLLGGISNARKLGLVLEKLRDIIIKILVMLNLKKFIMKST